jgi:GT2 family glycosyltransferase
MAKKTSVIMNCYNQTRWQTHMSMQALANITKFTDPEDYEMIVIDNVPKRQIRDDYHVLKIDKHEINKKDRGYTGSYNQGAKLAAGDYFVFIQNDVFVPEGWLPGLRQYLEHGFDMVFPDQVPRSREYVKASYTRSPFHPEAMKGGRDAGLLMIKRQAFEKMGGWDESLGLLAEKDFYQRFVGEWTETNKVIITHIMAATNLVLYEEDPAEYDRRMHNDAQKLNT